MVYPRTYFGGTLTHASGGPPPPLPPPFLASGGQVGARALPVPSNLLSHDYLHPFCRGHTVSLPFQDTIHPPKRAFHRVTDGGIPLYEPNYRSHLPSQCRLSRGYGAPMEQTPPSILQIMTAPRLSKYSSGRSSPPVRAPEGVDPASDKEPRTLCGIAISLHS